MDLTINCGADLARPSENVSCYGAIEHLVQIVVGKYGTNPTTADGETPTADEMQTYLNTGNAFTLKVTNGVKIESALTTITGADTYTGNTKVLREDEGITFSIRKIDNELLVAKDVNNLNNQIGVIWFISDNGILFGGKYGYETNIYIPNFSQAGFGSEAVINAAFNWKKDQNKTVLMSSPDVAYKSLTNDVNVGTFTITLGAVGETSGNSFLADSYANVTGWNKSLYPVLYADVDVATTSFRYFKSSADRVAQTPIYFRIDYTVGTSVINGAVPSTTLAGSLTSTLPFEATDNDTFTVTYTAY